MNSKRFVVNALTSVALSNLRLLELVCEPAEIWLRIVRSNIWR